MLLCGGGKPRGSLVLVKGHTEQQTRTSKLSATGCCQSHVNDALVSANPQNFTRSSRIPMIFTYTGDSYCLALPSNSQGKRSTISRVRGFAMSDSCTTSHSLDCLRDHQIQEFRPNTPSYIYAKLEYQPFDQSTGCKLDCRGVSGTRRQSKSSSTISRSLVRTPVFV